jgi:hypothetical protein
MTDFRVVNALKAKHGELNRQGARPAKRTQRGGGKRIRNQGNLASIFLSSSLSATLAS